MGTIESGMEKIFGKIPGEGDFDTSLNTGYITRNGQVYKINPMESPEMYKEYNPQAYERWYNEYGKYAKYAGIDVPKPFAEGGRVTQPTLAIIGEKEPETVVPDSKRSEFGNTTNIEKVEIVVNGAEKDGSEIAEEISRVLSELSIRQKRAVGGVGW
jgi:hypothetical protein